MPFNEAFGWIWITLGFATGALLGLGFHREQFLGGYSSWERRLLRLGHIAFFGTGFLNVLFAYSYPRVELGDPWLTVASWCFVVGAIAMPVCCAIAAKTHKAGGVFAIPVVSLSAGGVLTAIGLVLHELNRVAASRGSMGLGGMSGGTGLGVLMGTALGGAGLTGGAGGVL